MLGEEFFDLYFAHVEACMVDGVAVDADHFDHVAVHEAADVVLHYHEEVAFGYGTAFDAQALTYVLGELEAGAVGAAYEGGVVVAVLPDVVDVEVEQRTGGGMEGDVVAVGEGQVVAIVYSTVGGFVGRCYGETFPYVLGDAYDVVVVVLSYDLCELGNGRGDGEGVGVVFGVEGRGEGFGDGGELAGVADEEVFAFGALVVVEEFF